VNFDNTIINQLEEKGFVVSKVRGVSMWPLLNQKNTTVYIEKATTFKKYDCILFMRANKDLILHRIFKVHKDYYMVCGDNQAYLEKVYPLQIKGKMLLYYKNGQTKHLKGLSYRLYLGVMIISRPLRICRELLKKVVKKIIRKT